VTTDLKGLNRKLDSLANSLTKDTRKLLTAVGVEGKSVGKSAVQADIGDLSMSNWRRGRPIQIGLRFDVVSGSAVEIKPNPRASGPMRVLEQGRRAGMSNGRKRKGRVGATAARRTWTDATKRMEKELPKVVHRHTQATLRRLFS
jgi:hypothetical protein